MTARPASRLAWALAIVALVAAVVTVVLDAMTPHPAHAVTSSAGIDVLVAISFSLVGALIASRRFRNPIGWIMLAIALFAIAEGLALAYAILAEANGLPGVAWSTWLQNWASIPIFPAGLLLLLILLFPNGRLLSPRWRWVAIAGVVVTCNAVISTMIDPTPTHVAAGLPPVANPIGMARTFPWSAYEGFSAWLPGLLLLVLGAVSAVTRLRRARGDEREQMKWFAFSAGGTIAVFIAAQVVLGVMGSSSDSATNVIASLGFGIALPAACGVAILKYRLYDLDVVIKKTVVFAVLAGFITLLGAGAVTLASITGLGLNVFITAAIVVVLFNPMRRFARSLADRLVYGKRATPYEVLSDFSERLAGGYSADEVLPRMALLLGEATGAEGTTVWLVVGTQMRPVASWPIDDAPPGSRTVLADALPDFDLGESGFEVRHQSQLLGALTVRMPANDPMDTTRRRLAGDLASQAGLVLRNVGLIEELRASRQRLVRAQDQERRRIERNIHDGAQQQLVALAVKLNLAESLVDKDPRAVRTLLGGLKTETQNALEDLRDLARGIYPPLLADQGLAAALNAQARKSAVQVAVDADGVGRHAQETEAAVYFCALEALQNVAKYANASRALVRLSETNGDLRFEITDDGHGFDPAMVAHGTGLQGMTDRVNALGGTLSVRSSPGSGTTVEGRLPLTRHENA